MMPPECTSANRLYAFSYRILQLCIERGIIVCLENPGNSFLWDVLRAFEPADPALHILPKLCEVTFDFCCHGGSRPKRTKLLATPNCFESLHALCPGDHCHEPWGQVVEFGAVRYATKDEAAYPPLFAHRYAACLARRAVSSGLCLTRRPTTKDLSLAMLGRESRRRPLVSKYHSVITMPASAFRPQKHLKLLRQHIGGNDELKPAPSASSSSLAPLWEGPPFGRLRLRFPWRFFCAW